MTPAVLALEDGSLFRGQALGAEGTAVGEVVFNTAMTGYQEILTDPSYARQLVTLTYPHIGNVGCNEVDSESTAPAATGLIVRQTPRRVSNWRQQQTIDEFMRQRGVVGISGIDTRRLTRLLSSGGAQNGCIGSGEQLDDQALVEQARGFAGLKGMDLAREVSTATPYEWEEGTWQLDSTEFRGLNRRYNVVAYDFGVKRNILRLLVDRGCHVSVVPAQTPASEVLAMNPDGIFLSNGPGDPEPCDYAIEAIRELLDTGRPIFGICLGHQLLGLACGASTVKMKFGHHGANHPVQDLDSGRVLITSQNHGFAVDEDSLPECLKATHRSLFDGSLQGIAHADRPAFGFQGHPEGSPGPHDIHPLFDRFIGQMKAHA